MLWVPGFLLKWEIVKPVVMQRLSRPFSPGTRSRNLLLRLMVFSISQSIRQVGHRPLRVPSEHRLLPHSGGEIRKCRREERPVRRCRQPPL